MISHFYAERYYDVLRARGFDHEHANQIANRWIQWLAISSFIVTTSGKVFDIKRRRR
jgi:hypothetical protein